MTDSPSARLDLALPLQQEALQLALRVLGGQHPVTLFRKAQVTHLQYWSHSNDFKVGLVKLKNYYRH